MLDSVFLRCRECTAQFEIKMLYRIIKTHNVTCPNCGCNCIDYMTEEQEENFRNEV